MKVSILYKFRNTPWGGANQFLKAIKGYFQKIGNYTENIYAADGLLFVSYPTDSEYYYNIVKEYKRKNKDGIVINRMNGPISLYRGRDSGLDFINFLFNYKAADGTVFQSNWSRNACRQMGMTPNRFETIIPNAPDPNIFYTKEKKNDRNSPLRKIRLIATTWSNNPNKGTDVYEFLDSHLDFARYEMTLIGNIPALYKNISTLPAMESEKLAIQLRSHDIFVFPSKLETCSNSLLEALHCGLPVAARNNSSQPEIIQKGGVLFDGPSDVLSAIETVRQSIHSYQPSADVEDIETIGKRYLCFLEEIADSIRHGAFMPKRFSNAAYLRIMIRIFRWKYGKDYIFNRLLKNRPNVKSLGLRLRSGLFSRNSTGGHLI